jgi:hypothetical protein
MRQEVARPVYLQIIAPGHGRIGTIEDLQKALDTPAPSQRWQARLAGQLRDEAVRDARQQGLGFVHARCMVGPLGLVGLDGAGVDEALDVLVVGGAELGG